MARNWTEKQLDAIQSRRGSILVSAAAGSGKTAVLVERVIQRITDIENPCDANRLLIVTFTRAAASEMRQRIGTAVEEQLKLHPGDKNLINQQMLLPSAKICTIDSFCSRLVRDNFELLDISPDFKNADDGELKLLKAQAMDMTLDELYAEKNEDFLNLVELLFKGKDDSFLADMIYQLYNVSMSYPFPEKWLDEVSEKYDHADDIRESAYGNIIMDYVSQAVDYCLELLDNAKIIIQDYPELEDVFLKAIEIDYMYIEKIGEDVKAFNWNSARQKIPLFKLVRRGNVPDEYKGDSIIDHIDAVRKKVKTIIRDSIISNIMCCDEEEFQEDMAYLSPMVKQLCNAAKLFYRNFSDLKSAKDIADFNDISHMALSLLVKPGEGKEYEITDLAKSISLDYDEILIDEYQDTNKAQDMLFTSISRNNLFRVGDVKQSIYRFRRAMPEIFIELKNAYKEYDRNKDEYPAKIILGNNFRSRKSVTGAVNFVFSQIMSDSVGDIDYNDEEKLVFSASYEKSKNDCAELHIIRSETIDKDIESSDAYQARYIANLINKMIADGFTVKGENGERKATYGDFCILLRSINGERGTIYAEEMRKNSVPCFTEISANFFSSYEISLILSLLRIIDNPHQDIPLMTVMMSVLFGFTVDEVAKMRIADRKADIYSCLVGYSKTDEKSKNFLETIAHLRKLSISMGVEDFIRTVYDETAFDIIIGAMSASRTKSANLMLLLDYASTYEKAGYIGLSGFIGFLDRLERDKQDLAGSIGIAGEADVVKIMTIHKSKGLEFPVCIVANCGGEFNKSDEKSNMIISSKNGIGLVLRQTETMAQYPTVAHNAVKLSLRQDMVSEEMRVLYVAMTRAKEKLIMVGAIKDLEQALQKCSVNINPRLQKTAPFAASLAKGFGEWLLTAFLRHKDADLLRDLVGLSDDIVLPSDFSLKVSVSSWSENVAQTDTVEKSAAADTDFLNMINERAQYRYQYEPLTYAVSKRAASEVDELSIDREYFASSRPAFLNNDGLTAAQHGTITHEFMQFANYENASEDVEKEIERICSLGFITPKEAKAINVRAVKRFFSGSLSKRILKSELVMREKKFTVRVPIDEIYPNLSEFSDETVVIQGIADCAFVENGKLVVVDYKTDSLDTEDDFRRKYSQQVRIYKRALEMCTDYQVAETLLYSFNLGREIKVE
ncbi:MAG: helicase-exonuclease AddAB subunit AddA [Acutalibacteraceae bacterium]